MNYNFNREEYDPKLVEELQSYSDAQGTIRLSECSPEFLADYIWESTPEEDLQEAITANKLVGEPIPQRLQEAYKKYLSGMSLTEAVSDIEKQYRVGDIVFVNPASNPIGWHRFLITKSVKMPDDTYKYEGLVFSSKINKSNLRTLAYPDNIYIDNYDWMLQSGGFSRKPCYVNVREIFTFYSDEFSESGTYKGTVKPSFWEFITQCKRRVGTHDNQYWRWINGKAVNEKPSSDMTDEEFYEAMQYLPISDNPPYVDGNYYDRKEQRMKNHEWVGRTTFIEGKLWKCIAAETSEDDIVKLVPVGSNTSTEMTISGDKIWDIRWNKQK